MPHSRFASQPIAHSLRLGLAAVGVCGLVACGILGPSTNGLPGTAQALAQTAAAAAGPAAGTAVAGLPGAATALAGTAVAAATQFGPTSQALASQAVAALATAATAVAQITPPQAVSAADASAAITQYAQSVLGISVKIVQAGGLTADIQNLIQLPQPGDAAQKSGARAAVKTYGAILNGGASSLSYGSGTISGDLNVDINSSSLGAFSFDAGSMPSGAAEALALALKTYPSLANRGFTLVPLPQQGFAWTAVGQVPGYNRDTKQPTAVAEAILLAVTPTVLGHSAVSVVVGKGDFAGDVIPK